MTHNQQQRPSTNPAPATACIALGSNLGDREAHIRAAIDAIVELPGTSLIAASNLHETPPVGPPGQNHYLNACLRVETSLPPRELLASLLDIERARGRTRDPAQRWGPRTLDCDLVLYDQQTIDEPGLTIPHPRLHERLFVLVPLAEVAADMPVPGTDAVVLELLERRRDLDASGTPHDAPGHDRPSVQP